MKESRNEGTQELRHERITEGAKELQELREQPERTYAQTHTHHTQINDATPTKHRAGIRIFVLARVLIR